MKVLNVVAGAAVLVAALGAEDLSALHARCGYQLVGTYDCYDACQPGGRAVVRYDGQYYYFMNNQNNEARGEPSGDNFVVGPAPGWDRIIAEPNGNCTRIDFRHPNYHSEWVKMSG